MAKQNNTKNNASTDPKTDVVVQPETTPETENKNETPEIHSDSEQSTVETVGSEQTEGVTDTVLDSESEAETTGKKGIEAGGEIAGSQSPRDQNVNIEVVDDLDEESENKTEPVKAEMIEYGDQIGEPLERTMQRSKIAVDVFKKHPSKSVLYFTNDLIPFFDESDAIKHAASLKDKTVVTVNKQ